MKKSAKDKYEMLRQMLIDERLNANLKQTDVADRLGKPQSYISKIERGERGMDVVEFFEIAKAIDFDPFDFLRNFLNALEPDKEIDGHEETPNDFVG